MADRTENLPSLATERIDQMLALLREELNQLRRERDTYREATQTLLDHLKQMEEHWTMAERVMASSSRLEGELRESVREGHRLLDKMPGKRYH